MRYRKLKCTPLEISEISFGCMSLDPSSSASEKLLHEAVEAGINYFDTADIYNDGENERMVGRAFADRRDQVIVATKVGNEKIVNSARWGWNPNKHYIIGQVENSLRRLQTDYIDVYQLHGGTIDDPTEETIDAFETLVDAGKIRHYGISSIRPNVIRRWVVMSNMVSNMMQYSLLDRRPEEACLQLLGDNDIGIMVRGGIAKGLLAGKPATDYLGHATDHVNRLKDEMNQLRPGALMELAVQYVLARPEVTTVVLGMRTKSQLEKAVKAVNANPLSKEDLQLLQKAIPAYQYEQHR